MIPRSNGNSLFAFALLLVFCLVACHKEEQAVEGVAKNAEKVEHQAQANQTELDTERAELAAIPVPTKSLYVDVHDPSAWTNPFLFVGPDTITLRILMADANPSPVGQGTLLRPVAARRQELQLRPADLDQAIVAIPAGAWPYGRVIAVAESLSAPPKDRPMVRRNVESTIKRLGDLGIVVEEWPGR